MIRSPALFLFFAGIAALAGTTTSAFTPPAFVPKTLTTITITTTTTRQSIVPSRTSLSMAAIDTSDIKNGLTVELDDGEPYRVMSFSIMKQARGAAKTTIKFKNLMRGNTIENTYRSGEKFETAMIEKRAAQHTYQDESGNFCFMDSETFEEIVVDSKMTEGKEDWIGEGMECTLVFFKGKVIEVIPPTHVIVQIVETEPNVKGNTSQGYTKPATLSCGATINVPGYLEQGEMIKVDTENRSFMERAS